MKSFPLIPLSGSLLILSIFSSYCGRLFTTQLQHTEEFIGGSSTGKIGEVLIRCNNVLYVRGAPEEDDDNGGAKASAKEEDQHDGRAEAMAE